MRVMRQWRWILPHQKTCLVVLPVALFSSLCNFALSFLSCVFFEFPCARGKAAFWRCIRSLYCWAL
jgi:hypothetical protein